MKEKKRDLRLSIYPSDLRKFKAIAHLKGLSLSKTLEYFINREMTELTNTPYQLYQHYKNQKLYRILHEGVDEETGDRMVAYQCVNEQNADIFIQPKERFFGITETGIKRFKPFNPIDTQGIKLYNCIHDCLISEFNFFESAQLETIDSLSVDEVKNGIIAIIFTIKNLMKSQTTIQEDLEARKLKGLQSYGTYLVPFNGRNANLDALEELLDALAYWEQQLQEQWL